MSRTDGHEPWRVSDLNPFYYNKPWNRRCSCRMCSGYYWRKQQHIARRSKERNTLADLRKWSRRDLQYADPYIPPKGW